MRVWNYYRYFLLILLLGTVLGAVFLGTNIIHKTTRHDVKQLDAKPRGLPLPKYMVVAIHSDVNVFPAIIMQVLPQLTKEWTVLFLSADKREEPPKNWSAVSASKAYEELTSAVHSVVFSSIETKTRGEDIANAFAFDHEWWNATPTYIEYFWLVQNDAAVCTTNTKWCIHDFFGWDYLGAPWKQGGPPFGNGGFSIRSRRLQVECTRPDYYQAFVLEKYQKELEDRYFSHCLRDPKMHFRVAPVEVAREFATEVLIAVGSFGWHLGRIVACNDSMIRYCPEALSSYKRWNCSIPDGIPPVNITHRCAHHRTSAMQQGPS